MHNQGCGKASSGQEGGGGGGPVRVVLKHGTATKPPKVSAGGQRGVQGVHVRKCAVCAVIA